MKQQIFQQNILRVLALCLCIVMCFTLGACGSKENTSELTVGGGDDYDGIGDLTVGDGIGNSGNANETDDKNSGGSSNSSGKVNPDNSWINDMPKSLQGTTVTFAAWGDENATEYAKVMKLFTKKQKLMLNGLHITKQNMFHQLWSRMRQVKVLILS